MKKQLTLLSMLFLMLSLLSCNHFSDEKLTDGKNLFNKHWQFVKQNNGITIEKVIGEDKVIHWEDISFPHSANIEPLVIKGDQWQGTCFYKKQFFVPKKYSHKHLALYFEGAMQVATVYLNGSEIHQNKGGYLPFYIDISKHVIAGERNSIVVQLNNEDNPQVPPGKALKDLDFNIYGGIYRNVWLIVKEPVHITNPLEVDHVAGGGVFVSYQNVSKSSAEVNVKTDIINESLSGKHVYVMAELHDGDTVVSKNSSEVIQTETHTTQILNTNLQVNAPKLWSPSSPYLYTLRVKLFADDEEVDSESYQVGIRSIDITSEEGFKLNGEYLQLRGTNRHQEYPYIGYALSDNANYRDAYKIKKAGFNMVRLSHYPQSQSFLNACDELGILVMNAIPGWQYFGDSLFQENAYKDIRKMIRVDRNHPSVILWEASLNESPMTHEFMEKAHSIVHDEYPYNKVFSCGWINYAYDVFIPARQHAKPPFYWNNYKGEKPLFIAEYGDWEYYAQNAGFNQKAFKDLTDDERNSRQQRGDGQKRLAQQALNYQEAHNSNLQGDAFGDANWLMYDYNRGYAPDIETSGIMDIFRLPKFSYYFYQSQADIDSTSESEFSQPMVFISNYYNDPSFLKVKVYSNCDEIELKVNGNSFARQKPDNDRNSTHLEHPPYTFLLPAFTPGKLEAIGYVKGKIAAKDIRQTPEQAYGLKLWIDESGKPLQRGNDDIVFAYAAVVDTSGTILPLAENSIRFSVGGDAQIIGANPTNAEAGIATVLLKVESTAEMIHLKALSDGLTENELLINLE
ncbi:glycoside hydrolase family 2 TIM barrel-domain containing protein [Carboxylicivirga linearis]|uniref:DUF4982 domain-containing protein n=1 Tax=Carboxylicivirga linearis TaxID=1628157 RepID=A0ABS5JU91_9BACT|nr:glycoside hydrolase family 2 TIM barrel-domain containing protein [Carboxylicivirga linearis]MBS2098470.1 DUF4982 domain-containing protein [Carboxylicivirga linearis]